jgi:hypothetical protein
MLLLLIVLTEQILAVVVAIQLAKLIVDAFVLRAVSLSL